MFGITIAPGVDHVRIIALNGKKGKPPCLWEGIPTVEQSRIEATIGSDRRVVTWLQRNGMVENGVATLTLQADLFSQGKRVESIQIGETTLLVDRIKRKGSANDEVTLRAFDLAESVVSTLREMLDERDTVVGRLVERGLKASEAAKEPIPEPPSKVDVLEDLLNKGTKFLALANGFRTLRADND